MSLSYFLKLPEVRVSLKPLRPRFPRKLGFPLLVPPRSGRKQQLGIAFDYLLRFDLHRRAPHAQAKHWVAENAPWEILDTLDGEELQLWSPEGAVSSRLSARRARLLSRQAEEVIQNARRATLAYRRVRKNPRARWPELAAHAIRLAKLDLVHRSGYLDLSFANASVDEVSELVELLSIAPCDQLVRSGEMLLNPVLGDASMLVGGADPDLICGDMLVEIKTVRNAEVQAETLDQLLGYTLLARRAAGSVPDVRKIGIYFARHGFLWTMDTSVWLDHSGFAETEAWFFQHAAQVFGEDSDDSE